jgi:predicted enzyme related to lactoylglutathione lyase
MGNPVIRFQIVSKKPLETARFYGSLFGWKLGVNQPLGFRRIDTGSPEGIQGSIFNAPEEMESFVQLYMEVEDVQAAVLKAGRLGAEVVIAPFMLPEGEEVAVLRDPVGLMFAVRRQRSAEAPELPAIDIPMMPDAEG